VNELVNVDVLAANRPGSRRFQAMALQPLLTTAALEHKGAEYYSSEDQIRVCVLKLSARRGFLHVRRSRRRDWTGWLTMQS
jgi:hypothetical protein